MSLCQNGAPPLFMGWGDIVLSNDQRAIQRGIEVTVGTPPQLFSLRPSSSDYDMYIVNGAECAPSYNDSCVGYWGGVFNSGASTSFRRTSQSAWNGTNEPGLTSKSIYFNDVLSFGSNGTAYGYPLYFDQPGYGGTGALPLGWESTFLDAAFSTGAAPSRVWGLWTGSQSTQNPVDGSLVIGGYDSTRFGGESALTEFSSYKTCETCVEITGLTYNSENGSTNLFSNSSESLQVNLQPAVSILNVPQDIFMNFINATGGLYDYAIESIAYLASNTPTGNLTVTLNGGYKTVIPAEELFDFPRYWDQGQYTIATRNFTIAAVQNVSSNRYLLDWGIPYLTMNYLIGDYARSRFQLAPAIRTNFANQGGGYLLQASCDPSVAVSTSTSASASATSSGASTSSTAPAPIPPKNNTGAIVGGAVGGVLGLILIVGGLALMFYRSRRRHREQHRPDEVAQVRGAAPDRVSHYTGTTHMDNEISSEGKGGASVHQWLSSQGSDVGGMSPRLEHQPPHEMMSPRLDSPHEMPAERYNY